MNYTRFGILRQAAKELTDRGWKAGVRRHYPLPYEPDKVTMVLLTNAGPVEVASAWADACIVLGAKERENKTPLELCREDETLIAYE